MSDSKPSAFEEAAPSNSEKMTMSTTFEHIGTLEKEAILDVSPKVDLLSNLKRVCQQVQTRQNDSNEIDNYQKKVIRSITDYEQCICHSAFNSSTPISGGGRIQAALINPDGLKTCTNKYYTNLDLFQVEKKNIEQKNRYLKVAEKRKNHLDEKVGPLERFNAAPVFEFFHQVVLEKVPGKAQPEIKKEVRVRDNLNTLSNQMIDMNQKLIDKKQYLNLGLSLPSIIQNSFKGKGSGKMYQDGVPIEEVLAKIWEAKSKILKTFDTSI